MVHRAHGSHLRVGARFVPRCHAHGCTHLRECKAEGRPKPAAPSRHERHLRFRERHRSVKACCHACAFASKQCHLPPALLDDHHELALPLMAHGHAHGSRCHQLKMDLYSIKYACRLASCAQCCNCGQGIQALMSWELHSTPLRTQMNPLRISSWPSHLSFHVELVLNGWLHRRVRDPLLPLRAVERSAASWLHVPALKGRRCRRHGALQTTSASQSVACACRNR